jgi:hypothetical protein
VDTNRPLQFHKRSQLIIRAHNETLSVVAVRVSNPDRSPLGISLLIVADHLRRRFARFKLGAHLLNLRCLLVQTHRHSFHSFLLLRDLPAEIGSCDLPEAE